MSVIQAHGASIEQIKNYNSIATIKFLSIAEYIYEEGRETIAAFSHAHQEYEFLIPVKTIPLIVYDKASYIGEVGYIYPVNPMVTHGLGLSLEHSHCYSITVNTEFLEKQKKILGYDGEYFYTRYDVPFGFFDTVKEFQNEFNKAEPSVFKLESLGKLIVSILIDEGLSKKVDNRRPEKKYHKNIKSVILYMTEHSSDKDMNIESLAKMSGYSPTYFTKAFKGYMNDSPVVHLNKLRISEAKAMMISGEKSFTKIADATGYKNLSTFTEAFKRVTGKTPSEYYNKYIKN